MNDLTARRRLAPVAGWPLWAHFLITAGFALGVVVVLIIGGSS